MLKPADNFFLQQDEPVKGCLLALRNIILSHNSNITEAWKYGMPFYYYHNKMFCYLWVHKKIQTALSWYCRRVQNQPPVTNTGKKGPDENNAD